MSRRLTVPHFFLVGRSSEQEDTIPEWHNLYKTVTEEMIAELADEPERGEKNANDLKEYVEILKELDEKIVDMVENMKEIAIAPEEHSMAAVSNMIQVLTGLRHLGFD